MAQSSEDGVGKAAGFTRRQVNCPAAVTFGWRDLQGSSIAVIPSTHTTATRSLVMPLGSRIKVSRSQ